MLESFSDRFLFRSGCHFSTDLFSSVATHVGLSLEFHSKLARIVRPLLCKIFISLLIGSTTYENFLRKADLVRFKTDFRDTMELELERAELNYLVMWLRTIADLDEERNKHYWFSRVMSTEASRIRRSGYPSILLVNNFKEIEQAYTKMTSSTVLAPAEAEVRHRIVKERLSAWDYLVAGVADGMLDCPMEVNDLPCESTFSLMMHLRGTCKFLCWLVDQLPNEDIETLDRTLAELRGDGGWPTIAVLADTASRLIP